MILLFIRSSGKTPKPSCFSWRASFFWQAASTCHVSNNLLKMRRLPKTSVILKYTKKHNNVVTIPLNIMNLVTTTNPSCSNNQLAEGRMRGPVRSGHTGLERRWNQRRDDHVTSKSSSSARSSGPWYWYKPFSWYLQRARSWFVNSIYSLLFTSG